MVDPCTRMPCSRSSRVSCRDVGALQLAVTGLAEIPVPSTPRKHPSSTSSCMVYLRIALADAKIAQRPTLALLLHPFEQAHGALRCSRKFSSITKNDFTFSSSSMRHITSNNSSPVS